MRRLIAGLTAATILVALFAGPATAVPPKKVPKPTLTTTACLIADQLHVTSSWANQVIDPNGALTFTLTFKGTGLLTSQASQNYVGPYSDPSFVEAVPNKFIGDTGPVEWNSWSTIATSASGAFTDTASTIRQPKGGWLACV